MISADIKSVRLSEIDLENDFFRITARPDDESLLHSIETLGLIHAPLVLAAESGFMVVSGFKRIEVCRRLGFETFYAMTLHSALSMLECAKLAIADNMFAREFNGVETANALNLLSRVIVDGSLLSRTAGRLGLPSTSHAIERIRSITQLPKLIQKGIIAQRIAVPVAFELGTLEADSANALSQIFMDLNLSINRQREILTLLKDISAREEISIRQVLEETGLMGFFSQNESDHGEIARQMRVYLKKRRFPALCRKEDAFSHYIKSLKLSQNAKFTAPEHFEGMTYTLQLLFKNTDELKSCRQAFDKVLNHPDTQSVFE
jgi:ParB family transcriptional regulator, chromosome partitioning protein